MKLLPENPQTLGYPYNPNDFTEIYYFGDFLRKTSEFLKDDDEKKWELVCRATDVQSKDYPSTEIYRQTLTRLEREISDHLGTHEDPFILK